jgi:Tfp pilus assembly protein PilV
MQGAMLIPPVHNETASRTADCPRRTGAALLEVLVGLIVAAILLTPLAQGIATAMHHYTVAASRDRGSALQAYTLGILRADPCVPGASGDTTAHGTQVSWSATADTDGARELRATLNTLGDELEVVGRDVCR